MMDWTITTAVGATGTGLVLMERLASWRVSRRRRARSNLVAGLPARARVFGLWQWRGREIVAYQADGILRALAQPRLGAAEESVCVRWLAAEVVELEPREGPSPWQDSAEHMIG